MSQGLGALYGEHLLLGASLSQAVEGLPPAVGSYAGEKDLAHVREGAILSDLTGTTYLLLSGDAAPALFSSVFAGDEPAVGEARFGAVLSGSGEVISVPLALRTGDHEHVMLDPTPRGEALSAWVRFVASAERDGHAPYRGASVEDASGMLVPLLLAGAASRRVLGDYLRTPGEALPGAGEVRSVHLDAIPAIAARVPAPGPEAWLLLVPYRSARVLWRSLLSFTEVAPVGAHAVVALFRELLPWSAALAPEGPRGIGRAGLEGWGLVRAGSDFVGARSLAP